LIDGWQLALTAPGVAETPDTLASTLEWITAVVPGTAALALQAAGRWSLDRPEPLHDKDIWYRARFAGTGPRTLRFGGLATIAEVWLNGSKILASDNMFLAHDVDVALAGNNELVIVFRSLEQALAAKKGRARWRTRLVENNALRFVRTTLLGHMTGWAPAAHAVGPWRPIEIVDKARDVDLHATLEGDDGVLAVSLKAKTSAKITVAGKSIALSRAPDGRFARNLRLPGIEKWWPHTHGTPALHRVRAEIDGVEVDLGQVGFRSIVVDRGADGRGFTLMVNGQPLFARGACWSASDLASLAGDRAAVRPWLEQARAAHMNMIRVGGTMVYESDDFFAQCDELGILVWQDFMFANMDYPIADGAFRASVEAEATQFLDRTRGHPSLAVLCGGSEVAQQVAMMGLPPGLWSGPLYDEILPAIASARRPDAVYVPNAPCGGDLPFSTNAGISHYYGVGAYLRPLDDARRANVRFTSECLGFANFPNDGSTDGVPRDRGADWDFAGVTRHYTQLLYGADAKHLQRAAPAEVMEATIAEWRRAGSACSGALVWMLKDFVPGAGWGVIDSSGAPKLAWHGLRRAFRPVQVAVTDEGLNGLAIHLTNETATPVRAKLALRCYQNGETVVMRRDREVELPPRSRQTLSSAELIGSFFDITHAYRFGPSALDVTAITLNDAATGERIAEAAHFPQGRGALTADPGLVVEMVGGDTLKIRATRFAACVQIVDTGWRPADEGFNLQPGEERIVRLIRVGGAANPSGTVRATNGESEVRYGCP
jgi:beta-mannosidase